LLVRCSNCQTQFALDEQVGPDGAAIRCSVCSYVFRWDPAPTQPWQVETVDGELFTAPDLSTLRTWIAQGRLHPDDRVSRSGNQWLRLGAMPEFSDVFAGFPDLPVVYRTFEPTPLPSLPDLGPPPEFAQGRPASTDMFSPGHDPSAEIGLADLLKDDPSIRFPLQHAVDDESERVVSSPLYIAQEISRVVDLSKVQPPELHDVEEVPAFQPEPDAPRARRPAPQSEPATIDGSGMYLASARASDSGRVQASREPDEFELAPARGGAWRWVVGVTLVAGVAVVVAVSPLGRRLVALGLPSATAEAPAEPKPVADAIPAEVERARKAVHRAENLAAVEASLASKLETGALGPTGVAALKLTQVELFSTRSLLAWIAASVDHGSQSSWQFRAQDDAERAGQIFAGTDVSLLEPAWVERVRTRLRLVQGRPLSDLQDVGGDLELAEVVRAAPLWREGSAGFDEGELDRLRTALAALPEPSATTRLLLALTHARTGDAASARVILDEILAASPEQASALALRGSLDAPPKRAPAPGAQEPVDPESGSHGDATQKARNGGGMSTDKLIHAGCDAVEGGRPNEGIPLLVKAYDRRPQDLDVLTCLGSAHLKLGNATTANRYYQLALDRSPKLVPALRGAARVAKASGRRARARELYQRLLDVAPGDREAVAFLDESAPLASASGVDPKPEP